MGPVFLGGNLGFVNAITKTKQIKLTNPKTLTVQANPIFGSSCCTMTGNMIPPVEFPDVAMLIASPRCFEK